MPEMTPERRAQLQKDRAASSSNGKFYSFSDLTTDMIRLAPLAPDESYGNKLVKYVLQKENLICPEETEFYGTPGVIAKARRALAALGTPKALEFAKIIADARRQKYAMKIISRNNPKRVVWAEAPKGLYQLAIDYELTEGENISNATKGRDVRITKTGSGLKTEYTYTVKDQSLLADTKEERVALKAMSAAMKFEDLAKLDEEKCVEVLKAIIPGDLWKQIKGAVVGSIDTEEDEDSKPATSQVDDEEETPVTKPAAKKPAVVEDDEDEVPAKPAAKAGKGVTVDDEDEPVVAKKSHVVEDDDMDDVPAVKTKTVTAAAKKPSVDDDEE
jgi:hypothetical protein